MNTSTRRILVIAGAAGLLLVAIWYFTLWSPEAHNLTKAHQAHAAAEQKINGLQSQVSNLQSLVKRIPADTNELNALKAALPDDPELDSALDQIHAAATRSGVVVSSVSPSSPAGVAGSSQSGQASAGGPAITLTIAAAGSYQQLMAFITSLSAQPRSFVVDHLSLSGGSHDLIASVGGRMFYSGSPTP